MNIADNDTSALPVVIIVATDADAGEPSNNGAWTFTRSGNTTSSLAVKFAATGTATRGSDYTLAAGQASATLTVTPLDDTTAERSETVIVTLSSNVAYTLGSLARPICS